MSFPLADLIIIGICLVLYLVGWRVFGKRSTILGLVFILCAGLGLRLYLSSDQYVHKWDERYHALVAKNLTHDFSTPRLYEDPVLPYDYRQWAGNHVWLHKPPLPLVTIAVSMSIFGVNVWALRLPSILLSILAIILIYLVGKELFSRRVGFVAALLMSFNGLILELVSGRVATDHVDIAFFFFILLAVYLVLRLIRTHNAVYNLWVGASVGCALLSKWLPALIVLPIYLLFLLQSRRFSIRQIVIGLGVVVVVAAFFVIPWQLYIYHNWPKEAAFESAYNFRHITESLGKYDHSLWYHFHNLRIVYGELVYLPCIWLIYTTFSRRKVNLNKVGLLVWFLVPFLFFTLAATKMQAYTLMAAPSIFLIVALFWEYVYQTRSRFKYKVIPYFLLAALILLPARYGWERLKPLVEKDRNPAWLVELNSLDVDSEKPTILFNCEHPIEAMFHLDCTAYEFNPDDATKKNLVERGYEVVTLE